MAYKQLTSINEPIAFQGGAITAREKALVPFGGYSMIQNMRQGHPGMKQRKGCAPKHTTADTGVPKVVTLYQFSKGMRTETHFFAQMGDGDVLEAADAPPIVTTGDFGDEVFSGTTAPPPTSWSKIGDLLVYSNGKDQHKIYAGTANYVLRFLKYDSPDVAPPTVPNEDVYDYTKQVTDGLTTTAASLNALNTLAAFECVFIYCPVPANRLTWTMGTANTNAAVGTLSYRKSDNTWADTSETDETISSAKTLGQSGTMYWTPQTDEIPCYMFGLAGFWYRWETSAQLSATVTLTSLTYGTDHDGAGTRTSFVDIVNVWSGEPTFAIEAQFFDSTSGATAYYETLLSQGYQGYIPEFEDTYTASSGELISIGGMVKGSSADADDKDRCYFGTNKPLMGIYVEVGNTPNTTATTIIGGVKVWTGVGFTALTDVSDGTNGLNNSGWITWKRNGSEERTQFQTSHDFLYWYYFYVDTGNVSSGVYISIETMPYYDIADFGISVASCPWKDRMVYVSDRHPNQMLVSAKGRPMVLNGSDYAALITGDGRSNKIACMKKFYNELLVWQEEKGVEGGTLTFWQGDKPTDYSPLVLSSDYGTFSAKSAVVVDGVKMVLEVDQPVKTLAFSISHSGVMGTDGLGMFCISGDIANYFDPNDTTNCIRRGYETEMWIAYDSCNNVLRLGLVTGASAVVPNTFPIFDLTTWTWTFDDYAQDFSCFTEVEAASGNIPILQYAGGTNDGYVYRVNTGTNDIVGATPTTTAIDAYARMEFCKGGLILDLRTLLLTMKVQAAGNCTVTPYANNVAQTALALPMTAENTSEAMRRQKVGVGVERDQLSLKFGNATASQELYLLEMAMDMRVKEEH